MPSTSPSSKHGRRGDSRSSPSPSPSPSAGAKSRWARPSPVRSQRSGTSLPSSPDNLDDGGNTDPDDMSTDSSFGGSAGGSVTFHPPSLLPVPPPVFLEEYAVQFPSTRLGLDIRPRHLPASDSYEHVVREVDPPSPGGSSGGVGKIVLGSQLLSIEGVDMTRRSFENVRVFLQDQSGSKDGVLVGFRCPPACLFDPAPTDADSDASSSSNGWQGCPGKCCLSVSVQTNRLHLVVPALEKAVETLRSQHRLDYAVKVVPVPNTLDPRFTWVDLRVSRAPGSILGLLVDFQNLLAATGRISTAFALKYYVIRINRFLIPPLASLSTEFLASVKERLEEGRQIDMSSYCIAATLRPGWDNSFNFIELNDAIDFFRVVDSELREAASRAYPSRPPHRSSKTSHQIRSTLPVVPERGASRPPRNTSATGGGGGAPAGGPGGSIGARSGGGSGGASESPSGAGRVLSPSPPPSYPVPIPPPTPGGGGAESGRLSRLLNSELHALSQGYDRGFTVDRVQDMLSNGCQVGTMVDGYTSIMHAALAEPKFLRAIVRFFRKRFSERQAYGYLAAEICRSSPRDDGCSALGYAAQEGCLATLDVMLDVIKKSPNPGVIDQLDEGGKTAVHRALRPVHSDPHLTLQVVQRLVSDGGADANLSAYPARESPLWLCMTSCQFFLGAETSSAAANMAAAGPSGVSADATFSAEALVDLRQEALDLLLAHGADPAQFNSRGFSPLTGAAFRGDFQALESCLHARRALAWNHCTVDDRPKTLMASVLVGHRSFLSHPELYPEPGPTLNRRVPAFIGTFPYFGPDGWKRCFNFLVKLIAEHLQGLGGSEIDTVVLEALDDSGNNPKYVAWLLKALPTAVLASVLPRFRCSKYDNSLLHQVCRYNRSRTDSLVDEGKRQDEDDERTAELCRLILMQEGGDVLLRAVNVKGQTALHICAGAGKFLTTQLLLDKGADPFQEDVHGNWAIHQALWMVNNRTKSVRHDKVIDTMLQSVPGLRQRIGGPAIGPPGVEVEPPPQVRPGEGSDFRDAVEAPPEEVVLSLDELLDTPLEEMPEETLDADAPVEAPLLSGESSIELEQEEPVFISFGRPTGSQEDKTQQQTSGPGAQPGPPVAQGPNISETLDSVTPFPSHHHPPPGLDMVSLDGPGAHNQQGDPQCASMPPQHRESSAAAAASSNEEVTSHLIPSGLFSGSPASSFHLGNHHIPQLQSSSSAFTSLFEQQATAALDQALPHFDQGGQDRSARGSPGATQEFVEPALTPRSLDAPQTSPANSRDRDPPSVDPTVPHPDQTQHPTGGRLKPLHRVEAMEHRITGRVTRSGGIAQRIATLESLLTGVTHADAKGKLLDRIRVIEESVSALEERLAVIREITGGEDVAPEECTGEAAHPSASMAETPGMAAQIANLASDWLEESSVAGSLPLNQILLKLEDELGL